MNLGAFLTGLRWEGLQADVRRQTVRCLKDILATSPAASRCRPR